MTSGNEMNSNALDMKAILWFYRFFLLLFFRHSAAAPMLHCVPKWHSDSKCFEIGEKLLNVMYSVDTLAIVPIDYAH